MIHPRNYVVNLLAVVVFSAVTFLGLLLSAPTAFAVDYEVPAGATSSSTLSLLPQLDLNIPVQYGTTTHFYYDENNTLTASSTYIWTPATSIVYPTQGVAFCAHHGGMPFSPDYGFNDTSNLCENLNIGEWLGPTVVQPGHRMRTVTTFSDYPYQSLIVDLAFATGSVPYSDITLDTVMGCETCSRVISTNPQDEDIIATTSAHKLLHITYYLNGEDYEIGSTNLKVQVELVGTNALNLSRYKLPSFISGTFGESVVTYSDIKAYEGQNSTYVDLTNLTATGTYHIAISAYRGVWDWIPLAGPLYNVDIPLGGPSSFYITVGTTTRFLGQTSPTKDYSFEQVYGHIDCEFDWLNTAESMSCLWEYVWSTFIPNPGTLALLYSNQKDALLSIEPWGSGIKLVGILFNDDIATGTVSISHTFNLAGQSQTLTLDAGAGLQEAMSLISLQEVDTIEGDPFEKFLFYWEFLWWLMFGLWLIKTLFGEFGVDYGTQHESIWSGPIRDAREERESSMERTTYHRTQRVSKKEGYMTKSRSSKKRFK